MQHQIVQPDGGRRVEEKSYTVKIPAGTSEGTKIRLKGEGGKGMGGGADGDLFLKVKLAPHPRFTVEGGHDLVARVFVTPWEAAFGGKIPFVTLDGEVKLTIPPSTSSGAKLRLKGKGLQKKDGERGSLTVEVIIQIPTDLNQNEKEILELWQKVRTTWDPRK